MKLSEKWLREWIDPPLNIKELAEQLSMAGLEVDSVAAVAPAFSHVTIGKILQVTPHPDAQRLQCCSVDIGGKTVAIVCGGTNVRVGLKVAVALVGAKLPGEIHIHDGKEY